MIQVWDEFLDRSQDPAPGRSARLEAAISFAAADELLVIGEVADDPRGRRSPPSVACRRSG